MDCIQPMHLDQRGRMSQHMSHAQSGLTELWRVVFPSGIKAFDASFADAALPIYSALAESARTKDKAEAELLAFTGRRSVVIPPKRVFSTACYYNAFPAAYWATWTNIREVALRMRVTGPATVTVRRSDQNAHVESVAARHVDGTRTQEILIDGISIADMKEGGWLWFDVAADRNASVTVAEAAWCSDVSTVRDLIASVCITTMNKPEWCIRQFNLLAHEADMSLIDAVYVVDQGNRLVQDEAGFAEASAALGGKLHVVRQGNVGGSGGFARGMFEVERHGESGYALLLDDDTVLEPESISRAIAFANHCVKPTIVGGNMLFLTEPTRLCSLAEVFNDERVFWEPAPDTPKFDDLAARSFTESTYLHRRADADYNAWWMCLIPVEAIRKIGLSFPFFIKNDDVEYGVRAQRAGFRTVTVPGVCLWHQSWMDKDDILDWQAYFHVRNKLIMGLLYSRRPWGGGLFSEMLRASASAAIKMRYSAVKLHQMAVRDVLAGPDHIGEILETRLPEIRAARETEPDAQMKPLGELPDMVRTFTPEQASRALDAKGACLHQLAWPRRDSTKVVDGYVEPMKAYWLVGNDDGTAAKKYDVCAQHFDGLTMVASNSMEHWKALGHMDSAMFVNFDKGTGVLLRRRPLKEIRKCLSVAVLYGRLAFHWRKYQSAYRKAFPTLVSSQWWNQHYFNR